MNLPADIAERVKQRDFGFRWRRHEASRVEGLSDIVFGFAIALLVVSLDVPRDFDVFAATMKQFFLFAMSFALIVFIWWRQYRWFRRYALDDGVSFLLNALLLFVVLMYVYPLKYLLRVFGWFLGLVPQAEAPNIRFDQMPALMLVFSLCYFTIFLIFALLYWHAWRKREELELDEVERIQTRGAIIEDLGMATVAGISVILALVGSVPFAGMIYFTLGPSQWWLGVRQGKRIDEAVKRRVSAAPAPQAIRPDSLGG